MMKSSCFLLACFISLVVVPCVGAEMGMVTLVDGKPRLLRGTAWFTLSEGVRIRDGDTIDLPEKGQLQIELTDGWRRQRDRPGRPVCGIADTARRQAAATRGIFPAARLAEAWTRKRRERACESARRTAPCWRPRP